MKALITSAGKGTRLEHLTHVTNKGLIKVGKVTLLEHTISALNGYGINEIYIITGHHYANVEKKMKGKAKCIYNPFYSVSGIIASIWFAKNYLQGQKFIFTPCDHIFHPKLLENCLNAKEDIVVSVEKKECDWEDAKVIIRNNEIINMGKDIPLEKANGEFTGLMKVGKKGSSLFWNEVDVLMREGNLKAYVMDALIKLRKKGGRLTPLYTNNYPRIEIDYIADLKAARNLFKNIV